jgi:hypothetical protein
MTAPNKTSPLLATRLCALFGGDRANGYDPASGKQDAKGKIHITAHKWTRKPTAALWEKHLCGEIGLGIIAEDEAGNCKFGGIDADEYDIDIVALASRIEKQKLPLVTCRSKSGGAHLYLFASEPVPAEQMQSALRALTARLGLALKDAGGKSEVITSNLWVPYCGGIQRAAIKRTGAAMTAGEFLDAAEKVRISPDTIAALAKPPAKSNGGAARSKRDGSNYAARRLVHYSTKLAAMRDGEGRDKTVNDACFEMGSMITPGWIDRARVESELTKAAVACGFDMEKLAEKLKRVINKGTREPPPNIAERDPAFKPMMVCVADVPPREVVWLWKGRIARGKLTIIGGHPGISKSTLTIDMAARVTVGASWPCGEGSAPKGSVVIVTSEDEVGDTIHPRLAAAGADVRRVHVLKGMMKADGADRRGFDLTTDIAALETAAREIGDVVMIIIDPVTAYMGKPGKLDSYRVTDVRAMFEPLQDMAARCRAAVIGINHLSKGGSAEALMRFLGSVGMVATSRASYLVARDKENPERRLFLPAKNNLGDDRTGFAFKVAMKSTGYEKPPYAVAVEWEKETVSITADEALAAEAKGTDGRKSEGAETAKKLISEMLRNGPRAAIEFEQRARELAISDRSMRTARKALGVQTAKKGKGGWEWYLPRQAQGNLPMGGGGALQDGVI